MLLEALLGVFVLFLLIFWKVTKNYNYWVKQGVYQIEPKFPFGSVKSLFTKSEHITDTFRSHAKETKGLPFYGIYFMGDPILVVTTADLVRQITVKDFDHFVDRNFTAVKKLAHSNLRSDKIWSEQMLMASGSKWKSIRSTFSPIFTVGKMKAMLIFMTDTCKRLTNILDVHAEQNIDFELREILGKYGLDTMASCAFGVDAQALTNDKSIFVDHVKSLFSNNLQDGLKLATLFIPYLGFKMLQALKIPLMKAKETDFFYNVVLQTIKQRKESKNRRNDLIDLMIDAIKGDIKADEFDESEQFEKDANLNHTVKKRGEFDEMTIVSNAMTVLLAGYDTTGSSLALACYQLAKNPDIQDKLRDEVDSILENDLDREITYDDLQGMIYMDQVISETLRFFTPIVAVRRICTKNYKIPGHDLTIEEGKCVWFNLAAIHNDPEHYENPHLFDPEHFSKEAKAKRHPYAFLPFGQGPRGCIGMRFALLEMKLALANLVRRYNLLPSDKTKEPLVLDPKAGITYAKGGLYIRVEKRCI